jgi:uncharacterized protein with ParB-like and HNH nuclease domain
MAVSPFKFESRGIGELLTGSRLIVPPNQRSYAWEERHITDFLQDINAALVDGAGDYFLGTVVLVQEGDALPLIADGQQRLATVSIILARIRDKFHEMNRVQRARGVDEAYLRKIDLGSESVVPQISLNDEDNEFFKSRILRSPADNDDPADIGPTARSNRLLQRASDQIAVFFRRSLPVWVFNTPLTIYLVGCSFCGQRCQSS